MKLSSAPAPPRLQFCGAPKRAVIFSGPRGRGVSQLCPLPVAACGEAGGKGGRGGGGGERKGGGGGEREGGEWRERMVVVGKGGGMDGGVDYHQTSGQIAIMYNCYTFSEVGIVKK